MRKTKYHIYLNSEERRLLINSLNDLRNQLIARADIPILLMRS